MTLRWIPAFALTALLAVPASSQTILDEGNFRISVNGNEVGTETFTIRRRGSGDNATTVAQGRVLLDSGQQTRTVIQLQGEDFEPTAYQVELTGSAALNITGRAVGTGDRFRATVVSARGEEMREFLVEGPSVVVEGVLAHHHYFLPVLAPDGGSVGVLIPRESRQVMAQLTVEGTESVTVAGRTVQARRVRIRIPGMPNRTLWVDASDRVLRLAVPGDGYTADRTSLP